MLPMKAIRTALGDLLAADVALLAPATANVIALIAAPFTPDENLVIGDLTLATFTDSDPIAGTTGAQQVGFDPVTQEQVITVLAPLGGYRWETGDTANLPQTIYGFALVSDGLVTLLAVAELPEPITLQDAHQFIDLDPIEFRFVLQPIS